ncbi:hypothetical protein V7S43_017911 [Phytophthora oleae]|uniref:Uncharacterized protein n=1 Tax=Phytophthora oleae TaxID=2107226 RepID=A0ABD3EVE6_9STRA
MDDYFLGREKAAKQRDSKGTEETTESDSDTDCDDSAALQSFADAIYDDDNSATDRIYEEEDSVSNETMDLDPAKFPRIPEPAKHVNNSIQSIAANGMLRGGISSSVNVCGSARVSSESPHA